MQERSGNRNVFRKLLRDLSATAPVSWLLSHTLHRVDKVVFRFTKGRYTFSSLVTGLPVVMLTTKGAKSGKMRTVPVLGLPDGDKLIVFASGYGKNPRFPAWYHNLRANPEALVTVSSVAYRVQAHEAERDERERLWRKGLEIYPGLANYQRGIGEQRIPVLVLSPIG